MDLMSGPPLADVVRRFGAVLLDVLVILVLELPVFLGGWLAYSGVTGGGETVLTLGIFVAVLALVAIQGYSALVLAMWAYGMTPGKWMLGMRVVHRDTGLPVGFWRMALREVIGKLVAGLICYTGFIWALFDANRQGWHDKIAKTLVVRTR